MAAIGNNLTFAKRLLDQNQVVAIPTETVYGLAGNALNTDAIVKIYEVKNRPSFDPLIAHIGHADQLSEYVEGIPSLAYDLMSAFWPGPLTLLLPKRSNIPDILTSGLKKVAIRMPNHELTLQLLQSVDYPLAAPSANPFGFVSPTTPIHVNDQLGMKIQYIIDGGACNVGVESTIIGFENELPILYRLGGLSVEQIEAVVGKVELKLNQGDDPDAPGMLSSHYSPNQRLIIGNIENELSNRNPSLTGVISYSTTFRFPHTRILSKSADLAEAARNIFSALRSFPDEVDEIIAELVPDHGIGRAINDRLRRASYKK